MNLRDKIIKEINDYKDKKYILISPKMIKGGVQLINDYKSLNLYRNMDENTLIFAQNKIINLIVNNECNNNELEEHLNFNLFFCGEFDEVYNDKNFIDFIIENKDKIIVVYRYETNRETREFFLDFVRKNEFIKYDYIYLNFSKLLKMFEENNIKCELDISEDKHLSSSYKDDSITKFIISYNLNKKLETDNGRQLIKTKGID